MDKLKGYKTNIGLVLLGLLGFAKIFGWITVDQALAIAAVLGPLTGIALRQGIKASAPK